VTFADPRRQLPTGTVTFLRTDVEGSMWLARQLGSGWDAVNAVHMGIVRRAVDDHGGTCVRTEGDAIFAVFPQARAAAAGAIEAQRAIAAHAWPDGVDLRVRMGLHSGETYLSGDDYGGFEVNRAARIAAAGHGGQIVISDTTRALLADGLPNGVTMRDLGQHAFRGIPHPETIHQLDIPGLRTEFPPLRTLEPAIGNLPERMTSLIGREGDLAALASLLEANRLVTVTGPGGIGKTSVAIEAARNASPTFRDGAWLVALDEIPDPSLVRASIARTLGLFDAADRTAADALPGFLSDRALLLILDNFEHVVGAAGVVSDVLRASPSTRIVVTSRAPLHVGGEQEYRVVPLAMATVDESAVRLFVDRARGVLPAFEIGPDAGPVLEICALLDGLPLGIEIAAARVASLPIAAIRDRLAAQLPLPGPARRDVPNRQRTLQATIAWSEALLPPHRQRLLRDLSVFDGDFALAQAEIVHPDDDVVDGASDLIDQSLLGRAPTDRVEPRYRMLTTIAAYALAGLRDEGREPEVRARHARAFLELAETTAPELPGPGQRRLLRRLRSDHANLRSATRWSIDSGGVDTALRLVTALWRYWQLDGHLVEGLALADEALAMPGAERASSVRMWAVAAAGGLAYWTGHMDRAYARYEEQLQLADVIGDAAGLADATFNRAFRFYGIGDLESAARLTDEADRLYAEVGDERARERLEWHRANLLSIAGRHAEAKERFMGLVPAFAASGDATYEAMSLGGVAWNAFNLGDIPTATDHFFRSFQLTYEHGDVTNTSIALIVAATVAVQVGRPVEAATFLGARETTTATYGALAPYGLERVIGWQDPGQTAKSILGDEAYAAAYEQGRHLDLDHVVELVFRMARETGVFPARDRTA
jgi:predicted ATPase/class 3 adenylate cyclase